MLPTYLAGTLRLLLGGINHSVYLIVQRGVVEPQAAVLLLDLHDREALFFTFFDDRCYKAIPALGVAVVNVI
jgi:hypothetical protein